VCSPNTHLSYSLFSWPLIYFTFFTFFVYPRSVAPCASDHWGHMLGAAMRGRPMVPWQAQSLPSQHSQSIEGMDWCVWWHLVLRILDAV
jgi:hypothetical protein